MVKENYKLQSLSFGDCSEIEGTREMYYRGAAVIIKKLNSGVLLKEEVCYDFFTYFNSLSAYKWNKYTEADGFYLEIEAEGVFEIDLFGHFVNGNNVPQKEWMGRYQFNLPQREKIVLPYPPGMRSTVVSFQINTLKETIIYDGYYSTKVNKNQIKKPYIALITTTFKKEDYIARNIEILNKELFCDPEFSEGFCWKIIDNGRSLKTGYDENKKIEIIPNKNVGGSGGFAKGMIEALSQEKKPTHILLMDDDVLFAIESFRRIHRLLSIQKEEYKNYFISGAMLEINEPNIQHEDIGVFDLQGQHGPAKPRFNLNIWESVLRNEVLVPEDVHQYSGWWYCCIPTTIARMDNLPLPFFIRGDDVEYSIRNNAKFITMNGICIWHEGFGNKFSAAMELYQVHRNDLILQAIHGKINDIKLMDRIRNLFWEEVYKYNYKGASLILDAVEDYLKGPEFIETLDGEQNMKKKKGEDNQLMPIPEKVRRKIDYSKLYEYVPLGKIRKFIYDYSYNGQILPSVFIKRKSGVIPYGWGYYQKKQYLTMKNYAIDTSSNKYVVYNRSSSNFKNLKKRYELLMKRYKEDNETVMIKYRERERKMESIDFWKKYLA